MLYLPSSAVRAAMPGVADRIELARRTLIGLVADADVPPKLGVSPREPSSITGAMPAYLRGAAADGSADLLGMKWVTAFPGNRVRGLDAIHATVVLNDAATGVPVAILDGGPITAERTAAVSGVCLQEWWPKSVAAPDTSPVVALLGAGVQGASHVAVLAHVAMGKGAVLRICDRHLDRAEGLAAIAVATGAFAGVEASTDMAAAVRGADVVLTMISFGADRQILPADALSTAKLIVAVDYDMCVPAAVADSAALFVSDDVAQLVGHRHGTVFKGYRDPDASIGEALLGTAQTPRGVGPIYANHLGVGLADVVFADAIVQRARELGLGMELEA